MTLYMVEYDNMEEYEDNYKRTDIVCSTLDKARQFIASKGRCKLLKSSQRMSWACEVEAWKVKDRDRFYLDPVYTIYAIEVDEEIDYLGREGNW